MNKVVSIMGSFGDLGCEGELRHYFVSITVYISVDKIIYIYHEVIIFFQ